MATYTFGNQEEASAQSGAATAGIDVVSLMTLHGRRWFRTVLLNPGITEVESDTALAALMERDET